MKRATLTDLLATAFAFTLLGTVALRPMTPRHTIAQALSLLSDGKDAEGRQLLRQAEREAAQLETEYARRGQQLVRATTALGEIAATATAAKQRI